MVEWVWPSTNIITGLAQTNHLYLEDDMIGITNLVLTTNGVAPPNTGYADDLHPHQLFLLPGRTVLLWHSRHPRPAAGHDWPQHQ